MKSDSSRKIKMKATNCLKQMLQSKREDFFCPERNQVIRHVPTRSARLVESTHEIFFLGALKRSGVLLVLSGLIIKQGVSAVSVLGVALGSIYAYFSAALFFALVKRLLSFSYSGLFFIALYFSKLLLLVLVLGLVKDQGDAFMWSCFAGVLSHVPACLEMAIRGIPGMRFYNGAQASSRY